MNAAPCNGPLGTICLTETGKKPPSFLEQITVVEIMHFCKHSVKSIFISVIFLFFPHFADSTRKILTFKSKNYVKFEIFREIRAVVISVIKTLVSRNFWQKCLH